MIKILEEKNLFFQNDPTFLKYFDDKKKSKKEKKKFEELTVLLQEFGNKVYKGKACDEAILPPEYRSVGYLDHYGYYVITDADRGYRNVTALGEDTKEAFQNLIIDILFTHSIKEEVKKRPQLQQNYTKRFKGREYFGCLYYAENALDQWNKYYKGKIPKKIITYYEDYLNSIWWTEENDIVWDFQPSTKQFDIKKPEKKKKIEKKKKGHAVLKGAA